MTGWALVDSGNAAGAEAVRLPGSVPGFVLCAGRLRGMFPNRLDGRAPAQLPKICGMSDEISDLRLFARLVDAGSLSAAARKLNSSTTAMSRGLASQEERLGVRLIARTTRRFDLTEEGGLLYERCVRILAEIDEAEAEAAAKGTTPRGFLRVGAPSELGRRQVAPLISRFTDTYPQIKVHLALSDAGVDLMESGLDVILRIGLPPEVGVVATKLLGSRRLVCASPAYLDRYGAPRTPDDLGQHDCIRLVRGRWIFDHWTFRDGDGRREVHVDGTLTTSSGEVLNDWALAGKGLALKALWDIRADLAAGRLIECLADYACDEIELYAVFLSRKHLSPRVRVFLDFIRAALS
jgi:DNA-binding transcriptional LysR family regulator